MKSALYHGEHDVRVEEIDEDELGAGDVRVDTAACGICGTDLHEYAMGPMYTPAEKHPLTGAELPVRLGHEFGGTVTEVGDDVEGVEVGDLVAVNPMLACNECRYCEEGKANLCEQSACIGLSSTVGGFSESVVVPAGNAHVMPEGTPEEYAALVEPLAVAFHGMRASGVESGETAAVFGSGPIGLSTVLCLKAAGVNVVLVEPVDERRAIADEIGADVTLDPTEVDAVEEIRELTDGGADVGLDIAGVEPAFRDAIDAVKKGGHVTVVAIAEDEYTFDSNTIVDSEISLNGVWAYEFAPQSNRSHEFEKVIDQLASGAIDPEPLITSRIDLDEIDEGFKTLLEGGKNEIKILVHP